jgi:hypothetical protein
MASRSGTFGVSYRRPREGFTDGKSSCATMAALEVSDGLTSGSSEMMRPTIKPGSAIGAKTLPLMAAGLKLSGSSQAGDHRPVDETVDGKRNRSEICACRRRRHLSASRRLAEGSRRRRYSRWRCTWTPKRGLEGVSGGCATSQGFWQRPQQPNVRSQDVSKPRTRAPKKKPCAERGLRLGRGDAPDFVEVGEAGIAVGDAMRRERRVQLVG